MPSDYSRNARDPSHHGLAGYRPPGLRSHPTAQHPNGGGSKKGRLLRLPRLPKLPKLKRYGA